MSDDDPGGSGAGSDDGDTGDGVGTAHPATDTADAGKRPASSPGHDPPAAEGRPWDLGLAWAEHRGHVLAATALFAVALLAGLAMAAAGVDLLELLGLQDVEDLLPEDAALTVEFIFLNNSRVYLLLVLGALSLGIVTVLALAFNGVVVGWIVGLVAGQVGVGPVLALIVPHGVFELPAFWIAGGIALRLVHLAVNYLRGARDRFLTRAEWKRTALLFLAGWVLVAIAAVIEVYLTPAIAEAIYGAPEPTVG